MKRRAFLERLAVAGAVGFLGKPPGPASAEPPPETNRIRLSQSIAICTAPQLVAGELLQGEGFGDVQYQDVSKATTTGPLPEVASRAPTGGF